MNYSSCSNWEFLIFLSAKIVYVQLNYCYYLINDMRKTSGLIKTLFWRNLTFHQMTNLEKLTDNKFSANRTFLRFYKFFKCRIFCLLILPLRFRKAETVWCGGARETHWATCHNLVTPSKTKESLKSPCFFRSWWYLN